MKQLVIFQKYPTPYECKTRLGKDIGYLKSAGLAKLLFDDLIHNAQNICDVIVSTPPEYKQKFETEYPHLEIQAHKKGKFYSIISFLKNPENVLYPKKTLLIPGDILASKEEISKWFHDTKRHSLTIGPSFDFGLYLAGLNPIYSKHC